VVDRDKDIRLAAVMQQPPAEEHTPQPPKKLSTAFIAAYRLANATKRAEAWRQSQVLDIPTQVQHTDKPAPIFQSIARTCMTHGITNYERYIEAQFKYSVSRDKEHDNSIGSHIAVHYFNSQQALERFTTHDNTADQHLYQEWESSLLEFRCCVLDTAATYPEYNESQKTNFVLRNKMFGLSVLFRYCVAMYFGLQDVAREYYPAALFQILRDPEGYTRAWGKRIPEELITQAEAQILSPLKEYLQ